MPSLELAVPPRLRPMLDRLWEACEREADVRAAWLGGSLARGIADDWSDIDLHLAVSDPEEFDPIAWLGTLTPLVLADGIPGVPGGFVFLTSDWIHVDIIVHPAAELDQGELPARVVLDRDGLVRDVGGDEITAGEPYYPADQACLFLYFMGNAVTVLVRRAVASPRLRRVRPLRRVRC